MNVGFKTVNFHISESVPEKIANAYTRTMNRTFMTVTFALLPILAVAQITNPDVTQDNTWQTICTSGWTKAVRPPQAYTDKVKRDLLADLGGAPLDYELDHIIPLAAGEHPTNPQKLDLQAWEGDDGVKANDVVETQVKWMICTGHITLAQGPQCFIDGWKTCPRH